MTQIKDGGPAFPLPYEHTEVVTRMQQLGEISTEQLLECTKQLRGISVRDYFAAKAMDRMIARAEMHFENNDYQEWDEFHAYVGEQAYMIADAMLKARME